MKFRFLFSDAGDKSFAKLPKSIQKRILEKLEFIENSDDPFVYAKKIIGFEKYYRVRVGNYRVIFVAKKDGEIVILLVIKIAHRKDIYEDF